MKKMTKTEFLAIATKAAQASPDVTSLTVEQLELAGYDGRWTRASELSRIALDLMRDNTLPTAAAGIVNWGADFRGAFEEAAMKVWGRKLQEKETARKNWRNLAAGTSPAAALAEAVALVEAMRIRGARVSAYGDSLSIRVERGWAIDADLSMRLKSDYGDAVTNPDDSNQRAYTSTVEVSLSWSGTSRSLADSTAALRAYRELIDAGAELESVIGRKRIVRIYPEPEPAEATTTESSASATQEAAAEG